MRRADVLAAVGIGGAAGATARYWLAQAVHPGVGGFPWATFWINVSGSFALGLLIIVLLDRFPPTRYARPLLGTGFLGGYTTFSTFGVEVDRLARQDHWATAAGYAAASVAGGLLAVFAGIAAARLLSPRRP